MLHISWLYDSGLAILLHSDFILGHLLRKLFYYNGVVLKIIHFGFQRPTDLVQG